MKYIKIITYAAFIIVHAEPPREIPHNLFDEFTLNKQIPVFSMYIDGTSPETEYQIDLPDNIKASFYSKEIIETNINMIKNKQTNYYGSTDTWLYKTFEKYPILGKDVAIIGSVAPWYESMILAYGGNPTTIEYNKIMTDDPRLNILTVDEFNQNPKKFDIVLSISSIEHDGLGRYGDPINPNGDLEFMTMAKQKLLKDNGHMILAMPVGKDCLYWNAHRVYGLLRLPLLLQGWEVVDTFGFEETELLFGELGNYGYQPIFYLSPNTECNK
jgi:hypothetical protein